MKTVCLITALMLLSIDGLCARWESCNYSLNRPTCIKMNGGSIYASNYKGVYVSTNMGARWENISSSLEKKSVSSIAVLHENIYAGTNGYGIFISTDNGLNWEEANNGLGDSFKSQVVNSLVEAGGKLFACTAGGLFVSADKGKSWAQSGFNDVSVRSLAVTGSLVYAGTGTGLFLSSDFGRTWNPAGIQGKSILSFAASGSNILVITTDSKFYSSGDMGASWKTVKSYPESFPQSVFIVNDVALATNGQSLIYISMDMGKSWEAVKTKPNIGRILDLIVCGNNIFALVDQDDLYLSVNQGSDWQKINTGLNYPDVLEVFYYNNILFAGTNGGGVYYSTDNGDTWNSTHIGIDGHFVTSFAALGNMLFAGTIKDQKVLFISTDSGILWRNTPLYGHDINCLLSANDKLYAGSPDGLLRSDDPGLTWSDISMTGINIIDIASIDSHVFACSGSETMYYSSDKGESWSNITMDNKISCLSAKGSLLIAGSEENISVSADLGASWQKSSAAAVDFACGSDIIVAATGKGVAVSTDNGASWRQAYDGLPDLPFSRVAIGNDYVFVSSAKAGDVDGGVYRTRISDLMTGINDQADIAPVIILYPNPASDKLFIDINNDIDPSITVYDMLGSAAIKTRLLSAGQALDVSGLAPGVYYLVATDGKSQQYRQAFVRE